MRSRLRHFTLDIEIAAEPGETLVIVGPSGCGKTTLLHCLAGLRPPDAGVVTLGDTTVFDRSRGIDTPTEQRRVGVVFQQYALFPHMSVSSNVAYGLEAQRLPRTAIRQRVAETLEMVGISSLSEARPGELSGGERQRVALARAVAVRPRLLLLDEPLAALDATARRHVRRELRNLLQRLGITAILVTHDYDDALVLGKRIVVLENGRVVREGSHEDLLFHPQSRFVADFTGVNYFEGIAEPGDSDLSAIRVGRTVLHAVTNAVGDVSVSFFPTDVTLSLDEPHTSARNVLEGYVKEVANLGGRLRVHLEGDLPIVAEMTPASFASLGLHEGSRVYAFFKATAVRVSD